MNESHCDDTCLEYDRRGLREVDIWCTPILECLKETSDLLCLVFRGFTPPKVKICPFSQDPVVLSHMDITVLQLQCAILCSAMHPVWGSSEVHVGG